MNRLKSLREEKGLYQLDIAKFLGVSITAITYYENEKRDMSPDTIIKLSNYFNVSTDYLLGKTDIRNYNDKDEKDFYSKYKEDLEGLTEEEISYALRFYKEIKKKAKEEQQHG